MQAAGFEHAGQQCYAYVLERAGVSTFDWVSLQLYEAFSQFVHDTTRRRPPMSQAKAIMDRAEALSRGFIVDMPAPHALHAAPQSVDNKLTFTEPMRLDIRWVQLRRVVEEFWGVCLQRCGRLLAILQLNVEALMRYLGKKQEKGGLRQQGEDQRVRVRVQVPVDKLVVGVANGWADGERFCRVHPSEIAKVCVTSLAQK